MRKHTCLLLILQFFCLMLSAQSPAPANAVKRIQVKGNQFVTPDQDTFIFRGLNASDPDRLAGIGHWNAAYFDEIKRWGANIVRLPVHPTAWRERGQEEYLKLLDQGVQWARECGLYVIIDWHSIGNLRSELYQHPRYETTHKETFEFWRTMAQHYKDEPTVAFFELFNEPTVYNGQLGVCSWPQWREIMEECITIIRAHGCQAVPLVAGFNWAYDLTPVATDPIRAEGIAYVSHPYPMKRAKPWEAQWTQDWGFVAEKYPVLLTEVGFCGADDPGAHIPVISDESYGDAITAYCKQKGISYVVWVFDPEWAPSLFTDWNFTPTRQGKYFKAALLKK
ncbi:MAG: glycoside hydrolase family 5 protein [Bacteroidetes bacterium]|nr:glycoside hydrolase family 5 protein [Bacteroidota bacterium]